MTLAVGDLAAWLQRVDERRPGSYVDAGSVALALRVPRYLVVRELEMYERNGWVERTERDEVVGWRITEEGRRQ